MNIEKLQMCRLCLVEDVRMFSVTNKDLQTLYEKLTDIPFVTEDSRPTLACVFCYTKLKQCCQLQRKCLEAEKMDHEIKPQIKQGLIEFVMAPTETINIINECQSGSNDIKEELPDDCEEHNDINEIKEEHQTEFEHQDSCPDLEDTPTSHSESDSEDDTPVMEFKIEEETHVAENKRRAEETQSVPAAKTPKLDVQNENIDDSISPKHNGQEKAKNTENIKKSSTKTFVTEDSRPTLACVFCYTKLKQCCQLQRKCLEAEKMLTEMLNKDHEVIKIKPQIKQGLIEFVIAPTETINIINECQSGSNDIKEELPDDCEEHNDINEIEEEHQTEFEHHDSCPDLEDTPTNHSESDSEDDTPVMEFKIEEETHVAENKRRAEEIQSAPAALKKELYVRITRLEDTATVQHKETERSTQRRTTAAFSKLLKVNKIPTKKRKQQYECDVCQRSYTIKSKLINHIRIHTDEKPYKCEICEKSFRKKRYLKEHFRIHSGEKPYKCDICQCSFAQRQTLNNHVRKHIGEKPYKCEICKKSFVQLKHLKDHNRIHTGGKPYKCYTGKKSFNQLKHLKRQNINHTGEKHFKCEICQKSFIQKTGLNEHYRLHSGEKLYKCEICQRSFALIGTLNIHVRTHTGEKPYKCEICQRSFARRNNLNVHIRIHTGEKPYKCEICQKSFNQSQNLKNHKRIHTGEKPYKC